MTFGSPSPAHSPAVQSGAPLPEKAEQILQGAMQVFLEQGFAAATMDRIAATAGVSKATIYSHFQDKEGLFTALVQRMAERKFAKIYGQRQSLDQPRSLADLRQMAASAVTQMSDPEELAFIRLVIGESGRFPALAQTFVRNLTKPGLETMAHFLSDSPDLAVEDPEAVARILVGSMVYFVLVQRILQGAEILPMSHERLVEALTTMLQVWSKNG